jgi:hypothetical protein
VVGLVILLLVFKASGGKWFSVVEFARIPYLKGNSGEFHYGW